MIKRFKYLNGESIFALLIMLVGVIWVINGARLGLWTGITLGSGLFPLIVGIILITLSFMVFIKLLLDYDESKKTSAHERKVLLMTLGLFLVCAVLINLIGLFVTLIVGLLLWFKLSAKYSWWKTIVVTVCIAGAIYGIFVVWLSVPFPKFFGLF